jgi:hypothetical protein
MAGLRAGPSGAPMVPVVQLVKTDFAAQRIAMYAQQARSARLISIGAIEHALDEFFFKLVYSFVKQNASLDHLTH